MSLDEEKQAELDAICAELGLPLTGPTISSAYPLDVSKPNIHDTKAEFLMERDAVKKLDDHAYKLVRGLLHPKPDNDSQEAEMRRRVNDAIDSIAKQSVHRDPFEGVLDLINDTARRQGLTLSVVGLLIELIVSIRKRLKDLEEQEQVFWTQKNRHPNHYARTIALRLAKRYAETHGKKPTVGTSRDGGHPSTDYGRALERIFALLEIKAKVIHPAKWAVGQLQDSDLRPAQNPFRQYRAQDFFGMGTGQGQATRASDLLSGISPKGPKR